VSEKRHITGRQIAAARALAGMSQADLAKGGNISVQTLGRMEASEGPASGMPNNVAAIRAALEAAGVEFTNGDAPGVKLHKAGAKVATIPIEDLNAENDE
jgi:transcriptional regulator with XRE-family HTH domain